MASKLVKVDEGVYVEVIQPPGAVEAISARDAEEIDRAQDKFRKITKLLDDVCSPIRETHKKLGDALVAPTEVELGISFEAGGNIYLVRAQSEASLRIKLRIK